jgi:hypothetical protein
MGNIEKFNEMASKYDSPARLEIAGVITNELRSHITDAKDKTAIDYG